MSPIWAGGDSGRGDRVAAEAEESRNNVPESLVAPRESLGREVIPEACFSVEHAYGIVEESFPFGV